jgi:hypothetical protein
VDFFSSFVLYSIYLQSDEEEEEAEFAATCSNLLGSGGHYPHQQLPQQQPSAQE